MKISKGRAWGFLVAVVLVAGTGVAGFKETPAISVTLSSGSNYNSGHGSIGTGHYNGSSRYIGCQIVGESSKSSAVRTCGAKDSQGDTMSCTAPFTDTIRMIAGESYVSVTDFNRDSSCESMIGQVSSSLSPKSGDGNSASTQVAITTDANNSNVHYAKGAIGTAHRSADNRQQIGCRFKATSNFSGTRTSTVSCSAYDNGNPQKGFECSTSSASASLVEAVIAIKDDSYLEITRTGGTCTKLLVKNDARYDSHQGARR